MKQELFGCNVDALTMEESRQKVKEFVADQSPHQHVVVNVNKIIKAQRDARLLAIINRCDLVNCDGMPVYWASRLLGKPLPERVAGIDLFVNLVADAARYGWRVFLLGAREEVVTTVKDELLTRYPELKIAGYRNGYWNEREEQEVVETIRAARPDLLFVAISSPKKEEFLGRYLDIMNVPFAMGVGGSFDVVAGLTKRAPVWMQKNGLEWFYRFIQEPRRLFGRYFIEGLAFSKLLIVEFWRVRVSHKHGRY